MHLCLPLLLVWNGSCAPRVVPGTGDAAVTTHRIPAYRKQTTIHTSHMFTQTGMSLLKDRNGARGEDIGRALLPSSSCLWEVLCGWPRLPRTGAGERPPVHWRSAGERPPVHSIPQTGSGWWNKVGCKKQT